MTSHAFLTGGSGFLGAELARVLAARGVALHALVRSGSPRAELEALGASLHEGELRDARSIERALAASAAASTSEGATLDVVHCAAVISYRTRDAALQREVNVEGTRHVLEACRGHAVRRVLHVSSVVTVGFAVEGEAMTEDHGWNGDTLHVDYVTTKRAAEKLALDACDTLDLVVVNPGAVFGPTGERSNSATLLRRVAEGRVQAAPPGALSVVGVTDVAEGCALALERGARGRRYLLTESSRSILEVLGIVARECGVGAPRMRIPRPIWGALERGARAVDALRPLDRLTPQGIRMLGHSFASDARRARDELGWRPRPFSEVVRDTVRALRLRNPDAPPA